MRLLKDLRYDLKVEKNPGPGGELPLVVISSCIPTFRTSDEVLLATTRLSGVPAFIELIDTGAIHQLQGPLKPRLEDLLR